MIFALHCFNLHFHLSALVCCKLLRRLMACLHRADTCISARARSISAARDLRFLQFVNQREAAPATLWPLPNRTQRGRTSAACQAAQTQVHAAQSSQERRQAPVVTHVEPLLVLIFAQLRKVAGLRAVGCSAGRAAATMGAHRAQLASAPAGAQRVAIASHVLAVALALPCHPPTPLRSVVKPVH